MKGAEAEERALTHLLSLGHALLARNYRVRGGEIDLVTLDRHVIVFTEVKHRARTGYGHPLESITASKVLRVRRAAQRYLLDTHGSDERECRFDVIAITGPASSGELVHLHSAF